MANFSETSGQRETRTTHYVRILVQTGHRKITIANCSVIAQPLNRSPVEFSANVHYISELRWINWEGNWTYDWSWDWWTPPPPRTYSLPSRGTNRHRSRPRRWSPAPPWMTCKEISTESQSVEEGDEFDWNKFCRVLQDLRSIIMLCHLTSSVSPGHGHMFCHLRRWGRLRGTRTRWAEAILRARTRRSAYCRRPLASGKACGRTEALGSRRWNPWWREVSELAKDWK